ncbi:MAG: prolyl oligopeptidase family serine peptidase [Candidatus Marinimicrobia bacterium]|nr:prolyl oligopeptidase family serine peptidase [Candidatus Neomarinimicrobiota bacterium]
MNIILQRRQILWWILTLVWIGSLRAQTQGARQAHWTPEAMLQVKTIADVRVSPDGHQVLYTVTEAHLSEEGGEYQTTLFLTDSIGSHTEQLSQGISSVWHPRWSPDGQTISYLSDATGTAQIWLLRRESRTRHQLTDFPQDIRNFQWSPDGSRLAFTAEITGRSNATSTTEKPYVVQSNPPTVGLYVVPVNTTGASSAPVRLTPDSMSVDHAEAAGYDWSPDAQQIAFAYTSSDHPEAWKQSDIAVVDVTTASTETLLQTEAAEHRPMYAPDGQTLAYLRSEIPPRWDGVRDIWLYSLSSGTLAALPPTADRFGRHSRFLGWSADGAQLYYSEPYGTSSRIMQVSTAGTHTVLLAPKYGLYSAVTLNHTGTHFGFVAEKPTEPEEAHMAGVEDLTPQPVSEVNAHYQSYPMGETNVLSWASTDGLSVEGLVTTPINYQAGQTHPLLVILHGGPAGVFQQSYIGKFSQTDYRRYPVAAFAEQGYLILRPNPRGSSGYGYDFRAAVYKDWAGCDVQDILTGIDALIAQGLVDTNRIGVMGWSYGGYLTTWLVGHSDRFRAASAGASVTNLLAIQGTTNISSFGSDYFGGFLWEIPQLYLERSPLFAVEHMHTPLLLQHGSDDMIVPLAQSIQLHHQLRTLDRGVSLIVYPNQSHSLSDPSHMLHHLQTNLKWFEDHLFPN